MAINKTTFFARSLGNWGRGNSPEEAEQFLKSVGGRLDPKDEKAMTRVDFDDAVIERFLIDCGSIQIETKDDISGRGSVKFSYLTKKEGKWL
jgi:hypothetical protein